MKFIHTDLGVVPAGTSVKFTLDGNQANVLLLDSSNFSYYKNGRSYKYTGGLAKRSPVILTVPTSGHWYAVVDMGGFPGQVKAAISII